MCIYLPFNDIWLQLQCNGCNCTCLRCNLGSIVAYMYSWLQLNHSLLQFIGV